MSERPKEHDWKSCVPRKGTEGSNPSLCASKKRTAEAGSPFFGDAEAAEPRAAAGAGKKRSVCPRVGLRAWMAEFCILFLKFSVFGIDK